MASMQVKRVWIAADAGLSYGEVVALIDTVQRDTPDLTVGVATRSQTGPIDPTQYLVQRDERGHFHTLMPMAPCFAIGSTARP
jgi:hypothetical protein